MIGRLKGILVHKQAPWANGRACAPLARAAASARPWMAGPGDLEPTALRHGRLPDASRPENSR